MNFILYTLPDRRILQGTAIQYDSFVMAQRGQDFDAKLAELTAQGRVQPYVPETEEEIIE